MKTFRFIFRAFLLLFFLVAAFGVWFCTGTFEYAGAQKHIYKIEQPLSVVCKRAMSAKELPQSENGAKTNIDIQKAAKSFTLGEPIECEVEHPVMGKIKVLFKINLAVEDGIVTLKGETCGIEPNTIQKMGMTVAEIGKIHFTLTIQAVDAEKKGFFDLLPSTGSTVIGFESGTDLKVRFRELGFVRSLVEKQVKKEQEKTLTQIDAFIEKNLMQPVSGEVSGGTESEKPKKKDLFSRVKSRTDAAVQKVESVLPQNGGNEQEEEDIDVSVLDEE